MVNILDLGPLFGDILVFGGPYGNLQATTALMDWADAAGIAQQNRICTGDVVAYCGDGAATISSVQNRAGPVLAGNCEKQLAVNAADCGCGFATGTTCAALSDHWYTHATKTLSAADRLWMAQRPDRVTFSHLGKRYGVIHGGATDISRFIWSTDPDAVFQEEIRQLETEVGPTDVILTGHSGIAFDKTLGDHRWINAGVIGMPPHDGTSNTQFVVLSLVGPDIHTLTYDHNAAIAAMTAVGLTQGYHHALAKGYWPSQDVLPPKMRR